MKLKELAENIWDSEFGDEPSELARKIEIEYIEVYLKANLGQLNILINTSFTESSDLSTEEGAIFTQIYLKDWYKKQARNILRGVGVFSKSSHETNSSNSGGGGTTQGKFGNLIDDWTTIKEGDTTITRSRPVSTTQGDQTFSSVSNESSRMMRQLSEESELKLKDLVYKYNLYRASPIQVAGSDAPV
tara:strand:- start:28954 stop:29517 length:564 start_codon:yes stop_codon:yes gene_type:complete